MLKENKDELDPGQAAPNTEHTEIQDEAEGTLDLHTDFYEQYDLSNDVEFRLLQQPVSHLF